MHQHSKLDFPRRPKVELERAAMKTLVAMTLSLLLAISTGCSSQKSASTVTPPPPPPPPPAGAGTYVAVNNSPASLGPCTGTGTTCELTLNGAISAGNLLVIGCNTAPSTCVQMQSISSGGTLVPVYSASGAGSTDIGCFEHGYVYPSTAASGPLTITFNAATRGAECFVRQYSVSSGTPRLDWASAQFPTASGTTQAGLAPVLTGTKDLLVQSTIGQSTFHTIRDCTSVSGYGNAQCDPANGPGMADLLNTTSTALPTWTYSGDLEFAQLDGLAFATDATPCSDKLFVDWSGASAGTTPTVALVNASSFGLPTTGGTPAGANGWGLNSVDAMTYQTASPPALHASIRTCGDGAVHGGATTNVMKYDFSNTNPGYLAFNFTGGQVTSAGGYFYVSGYSGADTIYHDTFGLGSATNNYITFQIGGTGSNVVARLECNGGGGTTNFSAPIPISLDTWYWRTIQNDTSTGGQIKVCTDSTCGTVVGSASCTASGWTVSPSSSFQVGQGGGTTDFPAAYILSTDEILDPSGTFPVTQ